MDLEKSLLFPKFKSLEKCDKKKFLIITLFGPNLDKLFKFCNYEFDIPSIQKIAIDIISALKDRHNSGYLHMDIKPNNIAILLKDYNKVFIKI